MAQGTSSANPLQLQNFTNGMRPVDTHSISLSQGLQSHLDAFERSCTEWGYRLNVSHLAREVAAYARKGIELSEQVKVVGVAFQRADDGGLYFDEADRFRLTNQNSVELLPFSSMADLFRAVYQLNDSDTPIRIIRIGDGVGGKGEYLILIAGTDGFEDLNSWYSNQSGMGLHSPYMDRVKEAMSEAGIPVGATVNLVGHSQGGHVAMLLADDKEIYQKFRVGEIITYGSPGNVGYNPLLDKAQYHNYLLENDLLGTVMNTAVENPEYIVGRATLVDLSVMNVPLLGSAAIFLIGATPGSFGSPRVESQQIGYVGSEEDLQCIVVDNGKDAHNSYDGSPLLQQQRLPFSIQEWEVIGTYQAEGYHNLHRAVENLVTVDGFIRDSNDLFDTAGELGKYGGSILFANVQNRIDSVLVNAPIPIQLALDSAMDDLGHRLTTGPLPSEAAGQAFDGLVQQTKGHASFVVEAGATWFESSSYVAGGLGSATLEVAHSSSVASGKVAQHSLQAGNQLKGGIANATREMLSSGLNAGTDAAGGIVSAVYMTGKGDLHGAAVELGTGVTHGSLELLQGGENAWQEFTTGTGRSASTLAAGVEAVQAEYTEGFTASERVFNIGLTEAMHRQVEGYQDMKTSLQETAEGLQNTSQGIVDFLL